MSSDTMTSNELRLLAENHSRAGRDVVAEALRQAASAVQSAQSRTRQAGQRAMTAIGQANEFQKTAIDLAEDCDRYRTDIRALRVGRERIPFIFQRIGQRPML